jgi:hypothetical protein
MSGCLAVPVNPVLQYAYVGAEDVALKLVAKHQNANKIILKRTAGHLPAQALLTVCFVTSQSLPCMHLYITRSRLWNLAYSLVAVSEVFSNEVLVGPGLGKNEG